MEHIKSKLRPHLEKELAGIDRQDGDAVQAAYARFRSSVEAVIGKNPALQADGRGEQLRQAAEQVIAEHAPVVPASPVPAAPPPPAAAGSVRAGSRAGMLAALVLGLVIGGGLFYAATAAGMLGGARGGGSAEMQRLQESYATSRPALEDLQRYLIEIRDEVVRRQEDDPASLSGIVGSDLTNVRRLDSDLWDRRPESMPRGMSVVVQADGDGYKVLAAGPLCWAAHAMDPALVDPRRANSGGDCTHFGYWNEAGAGF